ncbi:MAG: hypothetical protein ACOCP8_09705 [archaeon]
MKKINKGKFLNYKKSDTIVIYGSGYSINDLTKEDKEHLQNFDSIGFNWFCKSQIPTTFYLLREQTTLKQKGLPNERSDDILNNIRQYYQDSCLIIIDMLKSSNAWKGKRGWVFDSEVFDNEGIILQEKYYKLYKQQNYIPFFRKATKIDIFNNHVMYATCTISNVFHIITWMGYKRIIFVGVDLYDHRYFWLSYNTLRQRTKAKKRTLNSKHFTAKFTLKMVEHLTRVFPDKKIFTYNNKSLLNNVIPVYNRKK